MFLKKIKLELRVTQRGIVFLGCALDDSVDRVDAFLFHGFQLVPKEGQLLLTFGIEPLNNQLKQLPPIGQKRIPRNKAINQRHLMQLAINILETMRLITNPEVVKRGVELFINRGDDGL